MIGAKPFFQYTLVLPKCDREAKKQTLTNTQKRKDQLYINYSRNEVGARRRAEEEEVKGQVSHIIGAQRDPPSTASTEFCLAVGAEVAAAIGKLGLAADTAGGRIVLLLGLLTSRLRPNATHFPFVALKLLVQCSERRGEKSGILPISGTSCGHKLFVL